MRAYFSLLITSIIFLSCSKQEIRQDKDLKRNELIQNFTESFSKTSIYLRKNYSRDEVARIRIFNLEEKAKGTTNDVHSIVYNNNYFSNVQIESYFELLLESSINLLEHDGIYDSLINEFGNDDPANIITSAMVVVANSIEDDMVTETHGLTSREVMGCIAEALTFGVAGAGIATWGFRNLTVQGIVGVVARVAARFVGPAFLALAIWDLADCLIIADAN